MNMNMSPKARLVMEELAQAYVRAKHPSIKRWAFEWTGPVHDELLALGLLERLTQTMLRLSEKGLNWVMERRLVSDEIRWARAVFTIFAEAYAQQTSGEFWFRTLEHLDASSVKFAT